MTRLLFDSSEIYTFIHSARVKMRLDRERLANKLGISGRTLGDWQRGKLLPDKKKLLKLSQMSKIPLPKPIETREDWWSGRINGASGASARLKKYGCSYTLKQRQKGGRNSQIARKNNPEYYASLGCPIPRSFNFPDTNTNKFAEFIGVLLGDGCIQPEQVSITLNSVADSDYIVYVSELISELFQYSPSIHSRFPIKATVILISGKDFTAKLISSGMKIGNKVTQQVDVPDWIKQSPELSRWCLRGMMDTDGGIFTHSYIVKQKRYSYQKLNFSNLSQPLRHFAYNTLVSIGLTPKYRENNQVWLYNQKEVRKYLEIVGSSNRRLLKKFECYNTQNRRSDSAATVEVY